jgi:TP901 family phage tail tape measure protein
MAEKVVQRRLQIIIDESGADAALKRLTASADKLEKEIDKGTKAGKDMTEQMGKLSTTKSRIEELSGVISGKFAPSMRQAQTAVSNLRKELSQMSADNPKYAATFDKYKQASAVFDQMNTKISGFRQATNSLFSQIKTVALGVTVGNTITAITETVTGAVTNAIKGAAKLSDEIANIQKVTGLSKSEVEKLNSALSKIDTRTATTELRDIAVALGQAGQAATEANVKALDLINVALGDEFAGGAEEISNVLQVLRNNLTDIRTQDFGDDVTKIANALNELGANGLATAPVVTDIANRIAGVGQTFGVSSGEILGTAAAFQELGINTERGSTAYVKLLQKMASDTETFAEVAGISTAEFSNLVNNNINEALLKVAENSSKAAGSNTAFAKVLEDLGTEGAGVSELLSKLAANGGLVREKIDLATTSLQSNASIMAEFNIKNETLGAQVDKLGKKFAAAFNSSTLRDATSSFIGWLNEVTEAGDSANNEFDRTTQQFQAVESEIGKLIPRYDELQGRTDLNATEQGELRDIINRVIELVPSAASAFDEYGNALDLNKEKLSGYISDNKQLLRELESDAVDSLTERTEYILEFIPKAQAELNGALKSGDEERAKGWLQTLRKVQVEAVDNADLLKEKYGVELPAEISEGVNAIAKALGRVKEFTGGFDGGAKTGGKIDLILPEDSFTDKKKPPKNDELNTNLNKKIRTGKSAAQLEAERRKKELADVAKELQKIEEELFLDTLSPYEKRLAQLAGRYEQLFTKVGSDLKLREKAMRLLLAETQALNREFANSVLDDLSKLQNEKIKKAGADAESRTLATGEDINKNLKLKSEREFADAKIAIIDAVNNYDIKRSLDNLKAKQAAEDAALQLEKENAIKTAIEKGESVALVEAQYADKEKERTKIKQEERIANFMADFELAKQGFTAISDVMAGLEQAKLNRIEAGYLKEQQRLDKMLKEKLITEQDYHYQSKNLEEKFDREKKKIAQKEFKRRQILAISEILVNAGAGAIKLWASPGFPGNIPLLALLAVQTAAAIANTNKQKPPEFATGGILPQGSSHREGGIALRDNRTGRVLGEIEGGEPIISRKVYRANKAVVDALLHKGWAQDSTPLPGWYTNRPMSINIPRLHNIGSIPRFADGGFAPQGVSDPAAVSGMAGNDPQMKAIMGALLQRLNEPIRTTLIYGEYEEKGDAIASIRESGTIR